MSALTLSPRLLLNAPPRRDRRFVAEDAVPEVVFAWHEQVAAAFRASRRPERRDRRNPYASQRLPR